MTELTPLEVYPFVSACAENFPPMYMDGNL